MLNLNPTVPQIFSTIKGLNIPTGRQRWTKKTENRTQIFKETSLKYNGTDRPAVKQWKKTCCEWTGGELAGPVVLTSDRADFRTRAVPGGEQDDFRMKEDEVRHQAVTILHVCAPNHRQGFKTTERKS